MCNNLQVGILPRRRYLAVCGISSKCTKYFFQAVELTWDLTDQPCPTTLPTNHNVHIAICIQYTRTVLLLVLDEAAALVSPKCVFAVTEDRFQSQPVFPSESTS